MKEEGKERKVSKVVFGWFWGSLGGGEGMWGCCFFVGDREREEERGFLKFCCVLGIKVFLVFFKGFYKRFKIFFDVFWMFVFCCFLNVTL